MAIPVNFPARLAREGVLADLNTELGTEFELDSKEPTYYGRPQFLSAWPCLIAVPSDDTLSNVESWSPLVGDLVMRHRIVYVYEYEKNVDPYPTVEDRCCRILDFLAIKNVNKDFPESEGVDLFHMYSPPWSVRMDSEFDSEVRRAYPKYNLCAGLVEFQTIRRSPLILP